jgi:hemerythrin-like domain-containing protein
LASLSKAKDALEKNRHPPKEFFDAAVQFFREYADRFHHYKEEYLLFSLLAQKKEGDIDLEIGALRYQHELNRKCIARIEAALQGYETGNEIAVTTLLLNIASFISILKRHIFREDQLFFPMAEAELSEEEKDRLQSQFNQEETALKETCMIEESRTCLDKMAAVLCAFKKEG